MEKTPRNKHYLLNVVFLACVILLVVNDHSFKYTFSNWLTGKLSDAAGIILLPMLIAFIFPATKKHAVSSSALFFIFWKSPYSRGPKAI